MLEAIGIDFDQIEDQMNKKGDFNAEELLPYLKQL